MKVLVTASAHFALTRDGILWTANASLGYDFWARYLKVYDQVHLLARTKRCIDVPQDWQRVSGPGLIPVPLPDFLGMSSFIRHYAAIRQIIRQTLAEVEAIQLRLPCSIGTEVLRLLPPNYPYGAEIITDPYNIFAPNCVRHPLRPLLRWWLPRELRQQCAQASAALYVTQVALQCRYPCPQYHVGVSDVDLPDEAFVSVPRSLHQMRDLLDGQRRSIRLLLVGSLAQLYKSPDVLIAALAICVAQGLDLELSLMGEGKYRQVLEQQAARLSVSDRVHFLGQIAQRQAVIDQLDQTDLFVLPSRQEGLPRALVEAMARGLPCISSTVGGIPELLSPDDLVPAGDAIALAEKIREVLTSPERLTQMSTRNLKKAQEYHQDILYQRRLDFYRYVRQQTEDWLTQPTQLRNDHIQIHPSNPQSWQNWNLKN